MLSHAAKHIVLPPTACLCGFSARSFAIFILDRGSPLKCLGAVGCFGEPGNHALIIHIHPSLPVCHSQILTLFWQVLPGQREILS